MKIKIILFFFLQTFLFPSILVHSQTTKPEVNKIKLFSKNDEINIFEKSAFYKEEGNAKFNLEKLSKFDFKTPNKQYYYKTLKEETLWATFTIENHTNKDFVYYYGIRNPYLFNTTVFTVNNDKVDTLYTYNYQKIKKEKISFNYPTWKITFPSNTKTKVYIKIYESGGRTKINSFLKGEKDFLSYSTLSFGVHAIFLFYFLAVFMISIYVSNYSKKKFVVFYGLHVLFLLVDYLCVHGIGQSYLWTNNDFLLKNIRSISHALSAFFICLFFLHLYSQNKYPKWVKKGFIFLSIVFGIFLTLYIVKFFLGGLTSLFLVLWKFISVFSILLIVTHIYLAFKKTIPFYLPLAFILHAGITFINANFTFPYSSNLFLDWVYFNMYYITLSIEVMTWSYFIVTILKKEKENSLKLKKEFEILQQELDALKQKKSRDIEEKGNVIIKLKSKAIINSREILYIKSDGHYVEYYLENKDHPEVDRNALSKVLNILPSNSFVRIHKSFIVNIYQIKIINSTKVMLNNGVWINLSRTYKQEFKDILDKED